MSDQARDKTVGFVGLGMMGMPMARNILKAGFPLAAGDIAPEKTAEIAAKDAVNDDLYSQPCRPAAVPMER